MSDLTYEQANDEMLTLFKTAWETDDYASTFQIYYESVDQERPVGEQPLCRIWIRHASGQQRSLGGRGQRKFDRRGQVQIEILTPTGKGLSDSYRLAKVAADAFEGQRTPGGIWFRNVRISERGTDGIYLQMAVFADFVYDEVK